MIRQPSSCSADGYRPGGVYAPESLAAFSAMPLNSPAVQARTVSILESEPLAAAAMPIATAPTTFTAHERDREARRHPIRDEGVERRRMGMVF